MADFFRTNVGDATFIRGPARIMIAGTTISFPTTIGDVIKLSTYDAQTGWSDLGSTKGGISIDRNVTEEVFDVDQIPGEIDSRPVTWEQTITTSLADVDLTALQVAWEGGPITTGATEKTIGIGNPTLYTKRRVAVLFLRDSGKLRMHAFRKAQKSAQNSPIAYNKTGDQQNAALAFRALADTSIADVNNRVQVIFDQI